MPRKVRHLLNSQISCYYLLLTLLTCCATNISTYYGGQKISSTTVIPLTYALKQPLGTNNRTSHVDILYQCSYE
jgi:hypothetical protein